MKYLLDTHTVIWALSDLRKLSKTARTVLSSEKDVFVSTITLWEISLKYSIGKLRIKNKLPDEVPSAVHDMGFDILGSDPGVVSSYYKLPMSSTHKDPFDRMLIWQAIRGNYALLSKDKSFSDYEKYGLSLVW